MSFEIALRMTEILLAFSFLQQSAEHMRAGNDERLIYFPRMALSFMLFAGLYAPVICVLLCIHALFILRRFRGPYNGGSDRMGLLILFCLTLAHILPYLHWRELAFGYLALQLILSYFISGYVKIVNPQWRRGRALQDVFLFSAYPASESLRAFAQRPQLLLIMSWAVIIFELLFPFAIFNQTTLALSLCIAAIFHLANAFLFGLNRFFWVWLTAYPSILWLQGRFFEGGL